MDYILVLTIILSGPAPKQVATEVLTYRTMADCERNLETILERLKLNLKTTATVLAGCYKEAPADKEA